MSIESELRHDEQVNAEVARQLRGLTHERDEAIAEAREVRKLARFYDSARRAPIKPPRWTIMPKKARRHVGLVVAQMTDWHLDEVVKPEEVMYLNAYNRVIQATRIASWVEKVVTLPRDYMQGLVIEGLVIPATGDLFTGEIHRELRETNEAKLLASVLHWMEPVIGVLETLEKEYPSVYVAAVVGNHGRLSEKPIFKGRVEDNVEWFFWSIVRDRLKDRGSSVTVDVSQSMDLNLPLYGRNHLLTHGDQFKGGTGISGAYAPLSLGSHRKTKRQMAAQVPMKTMVIGHLHQLINIPGVIMGGTMKGYDEYAFGLNLPPEEDGASQAMWVTTPERAQAIWMPIYLQDRVAERW